MVAVDVLAGPGADEFLRGIQPDDSVSARIVQRPGRAALVIGDDPDIADAAAAPESIERVWTFARRLAAGEIPPPPRPAPDDPMALVAGRRLCGRIARAFAEEALDDGMWTYDHVGSTAVSGIPAVGCVDIQLGLSEWPDPAEFDGVLLSLGYLRDHRVTSDPVPGTDAVAPGDHRKLRYCRPDPGLLSILDVRLLGSPWWSETVLFRDWLRVEPDARIAYTAAKTDPDPAAKTAFFDRVRHEYTRAATTGRYRIRR